MLQNKNIIEINNGEIISCEMKDRNTTIPAGTLYKNVEIKTNNGTLCYKDLYIPDVFEMETVSDFSIMKKGGKNLLIPDEESKKSTIESFKEYYRISSKEAFLFLYLPIILISIVSGIYNKNTLASYIIITAMSFIIRYFTVKRLGDLCLFFVAPPYLYLLIRFF